MNECFKHRYIQSYIRKLDDVIWLFVLVDYGVFFFCFLFFGFFSIYLFSWVVNVVC